MSVRSPEMGEDLFREAEKEKQEKIHSKKIQEPDETEKNERADWESLMKDVPPENEKEAAAKAQWDEAQQKSAEKFRAKLKKHQAERDQGNLDL